LKFGVEIDYCEYYSKNKKLRDKGAWHRSRDLHLNFGTPSISPPDYIFMSFPQTSINHRSSVATGSGTGFLIREPFTQSPSSLPVFFSSGASTVQSILL